ncbi:Ectomycorrhiza-regulated small secreted protein [Mycena chlorophos]|uniref:Ectomycorrhiza-regulated small secreted protein n=1 Tax=Mycena chlorophos TaxID=658473 RepID=A0A8H6TPE6_MYCCL|nr:Ectomycorrhiza-regulated small secreted protein [Mycena chlorophos]
MRAPPRSTAYQVAVPARVLNDFELGQNATTPPVNVLRITCGVFPSEEWVCEARNWLGVTVKNVLDAIYATVHTQITHAEWDSLCAKQQNRVNVVFDARWRRAAEPQQVRSQGILRSDCLLEHCVFAGLSVAPDQGENTYFMTLRRPQR